MDDLYGRSLRRHLPPLLLRLLGRPVVVEGDGGLVLPWVDEKLKMDKNDVGLKRKNSYLTIHRWQHMDVLSFSEF